VVFLSRLTICTVFDFGKYICALWPFSSTSFLSGTVMSISARSSWGRERFTAMVPELISSSPRNSVCETFFTSAVSPLKLAAAASILANMEASKSSGGRAAAARLSVIVSTSARKNRVNFLI
jgi:hypothetical protein